MTEQQLEQAIGVVVKQIDQILETWNVSNTIEPYRDRKWGTRTVHITLRLDEISAHHISKTFPKIQALLEEYRRLREIETDLERANDVRLAKDRALGQGIDDGIYSPSRKHF